MALVAQGCNWSSYTPVVMDWVNVVFDYSSGFCDRCLGLPEYWLPLGTKWSIREICKRNLARVITKSFDYIYQSYIIITVITIITGITSLGALFRLPMMKYPTQLKHWEKYLLMNLSRNRSDALRRTFQGNFWERGKLIF